MNPTLHAQILTLKKYQAWRTGKDARTMVEAGIVPAAITSALNAVIAIAENHLRDGMKKAEPVIPKGFRLIAVNETFDSLMYWLDRCEQKGHLENCADLTEPWEKFEYREVEAPQPADPCKTCNDNGADGNILKVDHSEMSREALEQHATRMAQMVADDKPRQFYDRYALGPASTPSCICCGRIPGAIAVRHSEIPGIVVCQKCHDAATKPAEKVTISETVASDYSETVSVPSDDELLEWAGQEQFFLFCDEDEFLDIARALIAKYGTQK